MEKIKFLNRTVALVTIITLIFIKIDKSVYIVVLSWVLNVIVINNVQKIKNKKYEKILTFVRRTIYLSPLIFPFFFLHKVLKYELNVKGVMLGIFVGILFIFPKKTTYQLFLSRDYIEFLGKEQRYKVLGNCYSLIFGSICEELYFKIIIIGILKSYIDIFSVVLSSYLFFLHHYLTKKFNKFDKKDFYFQIIFSFITGGLYYINENILFVIICHITLNFPLIIFQIKRGMLR